jgi:hypothetical protein
MAPVAGVGSLPYADPEDLVTVVAMLGNQLKTPYELQIYRGTMSSLFTRPTPTSVKSGNTNNNNTSITKFVPSQTSIYGNSLSAILLLVDPDLTTLSQSLKGSIPRFTYISEFAM